jgi:hypothetical protein
MSATPPIIAVSRDFSSLSNNACIMIGNSLPLPYMITYFLLNLILFVAILSSYVAVIKTLSKSAQQSKSKHASTASVMARLGAVVMTNFIEWLTMCIMAIISLSGIRLFSSIEALVSLIIFPLNAILNPIINTLSTKQFAQSIYREKKKIV